MSSPLHDVRHAVRLLRRNPGFTAVALLTLALGVGLNSSMFRLVDAVLLRELPVDHPRQLVLPTVVSPEGTADNFSYPEFEAVRDQSQSLAGVFAFDTTRFLARVNGQTDYLFGQCVSNNFYSVLGVRPIVGRVFLPDDNQAGQPPVAVISYNYWQKRFAGDSSVLDQSVELKKIQFRIIGVAPASFQGIESGDAIDIWIPMVYWPQVRLADHLTVGMMGRLKPDATVSQASAELTVIDHQFAGQTLDPSTDKRALASRSIQLRPGARGLVDLPDELPRELKILMAVTGFLLLIACANIANLQLARTISRAKEIATRLALGASRLRLIRHLLIESMLLALIGGLLGFVLSNFSTTLLVRFVDPGLDTVGLNTVDGRVLWFSGGVAAIAGLLFGLVPAFGLTRVGVAPALQAGGRSETRDRSKKGLSQSLLVLQIALCVALLVGTGLMIRSLKKLSAVNPGFRRDHVLLAFLYPTLGRYQGSSELNLYSTLQDQLNAAPGVLSASLSRFPLLSGRAGWRLNVVQPGINGESATTIPVHCNPISPDFFGTMGIPRISGRDFSVADGASTPKVAIISDALARKVFPNEDALGRQLEFGSDSGGRSVEVVGVVRDIRSLNLRAPDPSASVYVPLAQAPPDLLGQVVLEIRTAEQSSLAEASARRVMQGIDPDFPLAQMSTQVEQASETMTGEHSLATLLSLFSVLAITLASIGLYGVIAYATARRTREIGIRMALGARGANVLRAILGEGMRLTLVGLGIGFVGAVAASRVLARQLFGVTSTDPLTFGAVAIAMTAVALAACYLPAQRAAKVDPMVALRYE